MSDVRAAVTTLRATEWNEVNEVLHALSNTVTVRSHYGEGHPAIANADEVAAQCFTRVLERIPDFVVAIIDNEFVVCERPLPELRSRFHVLAEAMFRHQVECLVFQKGMRRDECTTLATALAKAEETKGRVREQAQASLHHVLLRFAGLTLEEPGKATSAGAPYFVSAVMEVLVRAARSIANDGSIDRHAIATLASQIVTACSARSFALQQRSWSRNIEDEAAHAANVAMMTAAMVVDAGYPQRTCIDATGAAILHDIGHLFLPEEIRGVPEPMLDERARPVFRNHTFAGASMLLTAGCSPLWVAAAFEHHRGVDGGGYPEVREKDAPHELVRIISLANFMDRKRTLLSGHPAFVREPEDALLEAMQLEERYFGRPLVRRFLRTLGVYPPGTTVELSDGQSAVVTRSFAADPWRPQVHVLTGPDAGRQAELRDLRPRDGRFQLSIVRATMPPLMLPAVAEATATEDAAPNSEATPSFQERVMIATVKPAAPIDATANARAALGMDDLLDSLLTIPTAALGTPSISSVPPPVAPPPPPPPVPVASVPPAPSVRPQRVSSGYSMTAMRAPPGASQYPRTPSGRTVTAPPIKPPEPTKIDKRAVPKIIAPDLARVGLDHRGAFLLGFIDGGTSVEDIVDASGIGEEEALAILADLEKRGAISLR